MLSYVTHNGTLYVQTSCLLFDDSIHWWWCRMDKGIFPEVSMYACMYICVYTHLFLSLYIHTGFKYCHSFQQTGSCRFGDRCKFMHNKDDGPRRRESFGMFACIYVCMYICIYVYIHNHYLLITICISSTKRWKKWSKTRFILTITSSCTCFIRETFWEIFRCGCTSGETYIHTYKIDPRSSQCIDWFQWSTHVTVVENWFFFVVFCVMLHVHSDVLLLWALTCDSIDVYSVYSLFIYAYVCIDGIVCHNIRLRFHGIHNTTHQSYYTAFLDSFCLHPPSAHLLINVCMYVYICFRSRLLRWIMV